MSTTNITSRLEKVSDYADFLTVVNQIAIERKISIMDTSKIRSLTSAREYLDEAIRIAECVKKREVGLYYVELINIHEDLFNNKKVLLELNENETISVCASKALKLAGKPKPKDEFFTFQPWNTPKNALQAIATRSKEISDFLGVPVCSGARSTLNLA